MIRSRAGWCVRCNSERPAMRAYPVQGARRRIWMCMVCRDPMDFGKAWSAAVPARDATGRMRQSTSEARRGTHLLTLKNAGLITDLRFCNDHPRERFTLNVFGSQPVMALVDAVLDLVLNQQTLTDEGRATLRRRVQDVERARHVIAHYTPDFSYTDDRGVHHVEDVKGRQHEHWPMKKALMLACHGIEVEVPDMRRESRRRKRAC